MFHETHAVITRLNEAFNGVWSFEVLDFKTLEGEIVVHGKLTAGGVTKQQFGGSEIARHKDSGKPVSVGDDLKSAASDALKKCATLFGVGLHLYEKADRPAQRPPAQQADQGGGSRPHGSDRLGGKPGQVQTRQGQPVSGNGRAVNGA